MNEIDQNVVPLANRNIAYCTCPAFPIALEAVHCATKELWRFDSRHYKAILEDHEVMHPDEEWFWACGSVRQQCNREIEATVTGVLWKGRSLLRYPPDQVVLETDACFYPQLDLCWEDRLSPYTQKARAKGKAICKIGCGFSGTVFQVEHFLLRSLTLCIT
jgi:hypothetical protein